MARIKWIFPVWAFLLATSIQSHGLKEDRVEINPSAGSGHLSRLELDMWNDPAFKRAFTESYIAETDIEPRVTIPEREKLQEILEIISADNLAAAASTLESLLGRKAPVKIQGANTVWEKSGRGDSGWRRERGFDFTLANIYFQQDKLDKAVEGYLAAVAKHPKFRRAWKNLGLIYVRQGDFVKARSALTRVIELGGNDAITYGLLAFSYSATEDSLSAESAYRMAILLDPVTLDWKLGLAKSSFTQARYAEAAALCESLARKYPDRTDLWLSLANAYIGLDKPLKAAELFQLVNHLGKGTVESLAMLGDIYINEELYSAAVESYVEAMNKKDANISDRALRAAKVMTAQGAMDDTGKLLNQIESHYGDNLQTEDHKDLLRMKARLAVASGANEEEARILKQIVALDPLDGEALILLGQHSAREAGEATTTADKLAENNGASKEVASQIEAARKEADEKLAKAVFYYERAEGIEKFEADAKIRHAQLLVGQGKYAEALPLIRRAQLIKPRDTVQKYLEQVERVAKSR